MNCPKCFGTGLVLQWSRPYPCDACVGRGVIHCCEGDRATEPLPSVHPAFDDPEPAG